MQNKQNKLFECKECNMLYKEKELAEKCENWCRKYKSCNLEFVKNHQSKTLWHVAYRKLSAWFLSMLENITSFRVT